MKVDVELLNQLHSFFLRLILVRCVYHEVYTQDEGYPSFGRGGIDGSEHFERSQFEAAVLCINFNVEVVTSAKL